MIQSLLPKQKSKTSWKRRKRWWLTEKRTPKIEPKPKQRRWKSPRRSGKRRKEINHAGHTMGPHTSGRIAPTTQRTVAEEDAGNSSTTLGEALTTASTATSMAEEKASKAEASKEEDEDSREEALVEVEAIHRKSIT